MNKIEETAQAVDFQGKQQIILGGGCFWCTKAGA